MPPGLERINTSSSSKWNREKSCDDLYINFDDGVLPPGNLTRGQVGELDMVLIPDLHKAARDGKAQLVSALVKTERESISSVDCANQTAMHYACGSQHDTALEIVSTLVKSGASPNLKDTWGCTPLHNAVRSNRTDLVKFLVGVGGSYPINLNCSDIFMNTPLHLAAELHRTDCAKLLLEAGANYTVLNSENLTAAMKAKAANYVDIVNLLIAAVDKGRHADMDWSS
mmetsp:Transcript_15295/g.28133  ORF Transcript_15295/g.28133 Transcript_15295/m.28133 type:complete len:227 (-) Transcript_15295:153-833(-)